MKQSAKELFGKRADYLQLPLAKFNSAFVFLPGSILGKESGPGLPVRNDAHAVRLTHRMDGGRPLRELVDRAETLGHQSGMTGVAGNHQRKGPGRLPDVAVSQVEAEEVGVGGPLEIVPFIRSGFASCEHELMFAGQTDVQWAGEETQATDSSLGWTIPGL